MSIATLEQFKSFAEIKSNDQSVDMQRILDAAEEWICKSFLNLPNVLLGPFTDLVDGTGTMLLTVRSMPIVSITSVTANDLPVPATSYRIAPVGPFLYGVNGYCWPKGLFNVLVSGTSGWATPPGPIVQAGIELATRAWKERIRKGQVSKQLSGETVTFSEADILPETKMLIQNYRRVSMA